MKNVDPTLCPLLRVGLAATTSGVLSRFKGPILYPNARFIILITAPTAAVEKREGGDATIARGSR